MKTIQDWYRALIILSFLLVAACKEPFELPSGSSTTNILVVEGFLSTNGLTTITLSRTQNIQKKTINLPEEGAGVIVESDVGQSFPLMEGANGQYQIPELNIPGNHNIV